jgi:hypothetical protein
MVQNGDKLSQKFTHYLLQSFFRRAFQAPDDQNYQIFCAGVHHLVGSLGWDIQGGVRDQV